MANLPENKNRTYHTASSLYALKHSLPKVVIYGNNTPNWYLASKKPSGIAGLIVDR